MSRAAGGGVPANKRYAPACCPRGGATNGGAWGHPGPTAVRLGARISTDLRRRRRPAGMGIFIPGGGPQAGGNCWRIHAGSIVSLMGTLMLAGSPRPYVAATNSPAVSALPRRSGGRGRGRRSGRRRSTRGWRGCTGCRRIVAAWAPARSITFERW